MKSINNNLLTNNQKVCNFCRNPKETLKKCGRCKNILYCSKECQIKHWPKHKKVCKKLINNTTKKTSAQAKIQICKYQCYCCKNCKTDAKSDHKKTCKFDPEKWYQLCKQSNINFLITNLTGEKNSLFLKNIIKIPKHSNLFMACLGQLLDVLEQRLDISIQQRFVDKKGRPLRRNHYKRYFECLEKKDYVEFHPVKFNENGKIEYKEGMKSGIMIDYYSHTTSFCNLTSKGEQHLKEIQDIALNVALEMYFLTLIKQKNISFNEILNNKYFETLFKYRKLFLFRDIILELLSSKYEKKYKKFINKFEKEHPQNVKIRPISKNELNKISKKIAPDQIAFETHISKELFLFKTLTLSVENLTKKKLIEFLRSYKLI